MMHLGKTHYVIAHNKEHDTFIKAWWCPGAHLYFYQESDRVDPENMVNGPVNVDPMYGNDLSIVIKECYQDYTILEHDTDYTG